MHLGVAAAEAAVAEVAGAGAEGAAVAVVGKATVHWSVRIQRMVQ